MQFYRNSAEHGNAEAENVVGILYATGGDGVTEDDKQAVTWYKKPPTKVMPRQKKISATCIFSGAGSVSTTGRH